MTYDSANKDCSRSIVRWAVGFVMLATAAILVGKNVERLQAQPLEIPAEAARHENSPHITGVGSCTAAGCHGGGNPQAIVGSEYNIWISKDPHANAYATLFSEKSLRMARLLAGSSKAAITPPHEDNRCLACHAMTDSRDGNGAELSEFVSDGVGCEACHGPAGNWLDVHFEHPLSDQERTQLGMNATDSLRVRAQICVECHVGSPGRDVNHELIAAGHPRLQFSMMTYWEALPKHWVDAKDRQPTGANFDATLWAFGQAATAEAALRQLGRHAAPGQPWPEFAELNCTACHHDLRNDATLQQAVKGRNNLSGRMIASDPWNLFAPRELAVNISTAFGAVAEAGDLEQNLTDIANSFKKLNPGGTNQTEVHSAAGTAAEQVDRWATGFRADQLDRQRVNVLMQAVIAHALAGQDADWSTLAQAYDALASLQQTQLQYGSEGTANTADAAVTKLLSQLFEDLSAGPGRQNSSRSARQRLIELDQLLFTAGDSP